MILGRLWSSRGDPTLPFFFMRLTDTFASECIYNLRGEGQGEQDKKKYLCLLTQHDMTVDFENESSLPRFHALIPLARPSPQLY